MSDGYRRCVNYLDCVRSLGWKELRVRECFPGYIKIKGRMYVSEDQEGVC